MIERLKRLALVAETSNIWTDEHRLMPAAGVADTIYDAIELLEAALDDADEAEQYAEELEKNQ